MTAFYARVEWSDNTFEITLSCCKLVSINIENYLEKLFSRESESKPSVSNQSRLTREVEFRVC